MWSCPIWWVVLTWCLVCRSVLGVTTQGEPDEGSEGQEEGRGRVTGHRLRPSPQLGPPVPYLQPLEFFNPKKRQPISTRPSFGIVSVSPIALPFNSPNEKFSNINPTSAYPAPSLLLNVPPSRSSLILNSLPSRPSLAPPSHLQSVEWAGVGNLPSKLPQPPPLKLPKWTPDSAPVKQKHWDTILQAIGATNDELTPPTPPPILDIPTLTSVTIIKNDWLPTNMSSLAMLFNVTVPTNDTKTKQKPSKRSDVLVSLMQTQTVANKKPQHEYREVYMTDEGFNPLEVYLPEHVRSQIQQNNHKSLTHTQFRVKGNTPIHRLDTSFTLTSSTEAPEYVPWPVGQATSLTLDTDLRDLTKPKIEREDIVITNSGHETHNTDYKGQTDNTWPSLAKGTRYLSINENPWTDISHEYFPGDSPKILENSFLHYNPNKLTTKSHYIPWPMNSNTDSIQPQNQHYGISEKIDIDHINPGSVQHRSPIVTHGQIVSSALQNLDSRDTLPIIVVKGSMDEGAPSSPIQAQERDFIEDENTHLDDLIPEEAITVTLEDKKVPDKDIVYNQPWLHAIVQNDLKNWGYPYDKNALKNLPPGYENSPLPPPPNYYKTKADQTNLNDDNKFLSDLSQISIPKLQAQSPSPTPRYEAQFPSPKTKNGQHFAVVQASHMPEKTPVMIKNVHVIAPKPDHLPPVPLFRPAEKKPLTNPPYLVSGKLARGTDLNKDDSPILVVPYPDSTSPSNPQDRTSNLYPAIVPLKPASRKEDGNINPIKDILRITSATKSPRRQGSTTRRQTELMLHLTPPPEPSLLSQLRELLPINFPGFGPPKGEDVVIMQRDPVKGITVAELSNDLGDTLKRPQTTPKFSQPTRPTPQSFRPPQSSPPQFRPQQTPPQKTPAQTRPPHTRPPQPALPPPLPRPPQNRPPPQSQPQNRPSRHQSQPLQSQNQPLQPLNQHQQSQNIPQQPLTRPPQPQNRPPHPQTRPKTQNRPLQSQFQPPQTQFRPPAPPQHNNNQQNRQPQPSNEPPEQFNRPSHQSQGPSQELIRPPREHSRPEQPFNKPPQHINQPPPPQFNKPPQTFSQPQSPPQLNEQQPPQLNQPPQPHFNEPPQHLNQPSPLTHNKPSQQFTGPHQFIKPSPPFNQPPTTSNRPQEFTWPTQPAQQFNRPTQPIKPPQHNRPLQPQQQTRPIQQFNRPPQQTISPQPQKFRPPQPQEFRPPQPQEFKPPQPQEFRPPQPQEFKPPQPQEFRPPQPNRPAFNGPIQQNSSPQHTNPHNQPSPPLQSQNRPPRQPQQFLSRPIPQHRPQSRPQSPNFNNFQPPQTVFFGDFQPSQSQQLSVLPPVVNTHAKRNTNAVATTTDTTTTYTTTPTQGPVFIPWPNSQPGISNLKGSSPNFPNILQPTLPNMDFLNPINLFGSRESIQPQEESSSSFSFFPSFLSSDDNDYSSSDIDKKFENPPSLHLSPPLPRADSIQQNKLANSLSNILPKNEPGMGFLKSLISPLQNNQMFNFKPHLQQIMNTDANGQRQNNPNLPYNKLQTQSSPIQPNTPSNILQAPSQIPPNTLNNNLHTHQTGKETRESNNLNGSQGNHQLPNHRQNQENVNNLQLPNQNQQSQTNQRTGSSSNNSPTNFSIDSSSTPALHLSSELPGETRSQVEKIDPLTNPARPDNHNSPTTNDFKSPDLIKFTLDDVVHPSDPTYLHPNNHKKTNINKLVSDTDKPSIRFEDMDLSPSEDIVSVAEFVPSTKPTQPPTIVMERITFTTQGTTPPTTTPVPKDPQNNPTLTSTFSKTPAKTLPSNTLTTQPNIPVLKHNIQTNAQPQPTTFRPTTAKPITKLKTSPFFTLNWRATKPVDLSADNGPPIEKSKEGNWKNNKNNSPQQVPRITIIEATPMPKAGEVYPTVKHFRTFVSSFPYGNSDSNNHHITTTVPFTTATTAKSYTTPTPYTKSIPTGPHNAKIHHAKANMNQKDTSTPYIRSSLTPPPYINSHTTPIPYTKPNTTPIPYTKPNTAPTHYTMPTTLTPTRSTSKYTMPHSPFTTPAPKATTPRSYPKLKWSTTSSASPPRARPVTRNIPPGMMKKRNRQDVMMPGRWNHRTIVRPPKVNLGPGVNETRLDERNDEQSKGNNRHKLRYNSPPRKVQQVNRPTPTPTLMPDNIVTERMTTSTTNRMTQTHPSNVPMPSIVESREIPESDQNALLQESQTVLHMREPEGNERKAADKNNNENGAESQEINLTDSNQNTTSITKDVSFRLIKPPRFSSIQRLRNIMANKRKASTTTIPPQTPTIPATTQRPATENPRVTTLSHGVSTRPVEVNVKSFNSYRDQLSNRRRNRNKVTTTTSTPAPTTTRPRQYTTFTMQPAIHSGFTKQSAIRSGFTEQPAIRSGFTKQPSTRLSFTNTSPTIPSDFTDTSRPTGLGEGGSDAGIRGWRQPIQETLLQDHPEMLELYGWEPTKLTSNEQNNQDPTGSEEHDDQYLSDSNQPYQSQSNTNQQYQSQSNTNQQYQSPSNTNIQYKSPNRQYQSPSNPNRQYQSLLNPNTHNLFSDASSLHPVTLMPITVPDFVFGPRSSSSTIPTTRIGTVSVSPHYATVDRNAGNMVRPQHPPRNQMEAGGAVKKTEGQGDIGVQGIKGGQEGGGGHSPPTWTALLDSLSPSLPPPSHLIHALHQYDSQRI